MNRRDFLAGLGLASTGAVLANTSCSSKPLVGKTVNAKTGAFWPVSGSRAINPRDVKINLKPVMASVVHSDVWEGPCRAKRETVSEEKSKLNKHFAEWQQEIKSNIDREKANLLEPVFIKYLEDFVLKSKELNKLVPDSKETDAYIVTQGRIGNYGIAEISKHFNTPVLWPASLACASADVAAHLRSQGCECFVPLDYDELDKIIRLLIARKVFTRTRVLFPTDRGLPAVGSMGNITDFEDLKERLGVEVKKISYKELGREMDNVMASIREREKTERLADELIQHAQHSYLDRKYVVKSAQFYLAVKKLMDKHGCNAFTIECFEFCSSRLPEKWTIVPCLIHALLKDQGYTSGCEADFGCLLAMRLLMSVANKAAYMGNSFAKDKYTFLLNHSAPARKMNGYDEPDLAYKLGRFVESGWGTKLVVDLANNKEKTVTLARIDPSATKLLVVQGQVLESKGWEKDYIGCSVEAVIKISNAEELTEKKMIYGQHLPMVYGSYAGQMRELGEMLNLEVEVVS